MLRSYGVAIEYMTAYMLSQNGITERLNHMLSQNGITERLNHMLVQMAKSILFESRLPQKF